MSSIDVSVDISSAEKAQLVQTELARIGIRPDTVLTQDNLFEILDKKVQSKTYNNEIYLSI